MSFQSNSPNQNDNPYAALAQNYTTAAQADVTDRLGFIRRVYLHLGGAVIAFIALEAFILTTFWTQIESLMPSITGWSWLIVLGAFMGACWLAQSLAHSETSRAVQYAGFGLFILAEAIIFVPILFIAQKFFPGSIQTAGIVTAIVFGGLTLTVFVTRADFSFLRMALVIGTLAAFGAIIVGTIFQMDIFGIVFSGAMVVLMSGYILYETSNVLHHYRTDQHVAASLALFSSLATLFWYILRLVMMFSQD